MESAPIVAAMHGSNVPSCTAETFPTPPLVAGVPFSGAASNPAGHRRAITRRARRSRRLGPENGTGTGRAPITRGPNTLVVSRVDANDDVVDEAADVVESHEVSAVRGTTHTGILDSTRTS